MNMPVRKWPMRKWISGAVISVMALTSAMVIAEGRKVELPADLARKTTSLPKEKREFLTSEAAEGLAGSFPKLFQRLENRTPQEIEAYIDGLMSAADALKYNPETDMAAIPLRTEDPYFNSWKLMRPRNMDPKREPGPFSLSRYMFQNGAQGMYGSGISTFAGAPVALYPEDLIAGKVDVAIVGAPLDMGSGYRGAKGGPAAMRNQYGIGGVDMSTMVNPSKELNIVDYGDIAVDNMSTELTVQHVRERVGEIAKTGTIPFIVGGDHSLEYPNVAAMADIHGKGSFSVIHFDSHFDAGREGIHFLTHGAPVYRAVKEGHVRGQDYIQVGLRGSWPDAEGFEWMRNNGMTYYTMPTVEKYGWAATMEKVLANAKANNKKLYISFDVDILDPAFIPATGTPVPGGLTMREAIPIVRRLCAENNLIGFEIVELAPQLDTSYRSALNANFIMHACLTGVAMRKKGITAPGFLSDLTTEHMQPGAGHKGAKDGKAEKIEPDYGDWRKALRPRT